MRFVKIKTNKKNTIWENNKQYLYLHPKICSNKNKTNGL